MIYIAISYKHEHAWGQAQDHTQHPCERGPEDIRVRHRVLSVPDYCALYRRAGLRAIPACRRVRGVFRAPGFRGVGSACEIRRGIQRERR